MATKQFGKKETQQPRDYISEVHAIVPSVPVHFNLDANGELVGFSYESTWKTGGTTPVLNDDGEVVDYKANYKQEKLTTDQAKKLDAWAKENVKV